MITQAASGMEEMIPMKISPKARPKQGRLPPREKRRQHLKRIQKYVFLEAAQANEC